MKKHLIYLLGAMFLWFSACNLPETNIDPTRPDDVNIDLILPSLLTQSAYNQSANPARVSGIVMQYFEGVDAQQLQFTDYIIAEDAFNNYWRTGLYAGSGKDAIVIIEKALGGDDEPARPHYEGIAKIILANELGMAASYFGDVPYSEAFLGADNLSPGYDLQEDVFATVQTLLDEGIALLNGEPSNAPPTGDDLIFGGDAAAWVATAWAFKARYFMMASKRSSEAATSALTALGNAFTSVDEQPNFAWGSSQTSNNPFAKFGIERPNTLAISGFFFNALTDAADPRLPFYVDGETGFFAGTPSNLTWSQDISVIPLISYAELKFIEAEALLRSGAADAEVQAAMEAGIQASMDMNGVMAGAATEYIDAVAEVADQADFEAKLELVMTEAYYSYYGCAIQQAWNNFRRTGYPALTPASGGANGLNPSGGVPRRFLYPVSEAQLNAAQLEVAESRQEQTGDGAFLLDDDLWIFAD
jgi:hypothetical protein